MRAALIDQMPQGDQAQGAQRPSDQASPQAVQSPSDRPFRIALEMDGEQADPLAMVRICGPQRPSEAHSLLQEEEAKAAVQKSVCDLREMDLELLTLSLVSHPDLTQQQRGVAGVLLALAPSRASAVPLTEEQRTARCESIVATLRLGWPQQGVDA